MKARTASGSLLVIVCPTVLLCVPRSCKSPGSSHLALCLFILPLHALCISDHLACCTSREMGLLDVGWSHCPDPLQSLPAYNPSGIGRSSLIY